jgi:hypothetical protein
MHEPWLTAFAAALRQEGEGGAYVGFLGEGRIRDAYPVSTFERLAAIEGRYDPTNLFRLNRNIPPATEDRTAELKQTSDD